MVRTRENQYVLKVDHPGYCSLEKDVTDVSTASVPSSSESKKEMSFFFVLLLYFLYILRFLCMHELML